MFISIPFRSSLMEWDRKDVRRYILNNKVLLRERKRHTDRGVSSTPSVNRSGVPPRRVPPGQVWLGDPRWSTPDRVPPGQVWCRGTQGGVPPVGTPGRVPPARSDGVYPRWDTPHWGIPKQGTPPTWTWLGYPPRCGQTGGWMDGQTCVKT